MKRLPIWEIMDRMQAYGRTFYDEQDGVLYSNYTCGAFEVDFTGTLLAASFCAIPDTSPSPRAAFPDQDPIPREDWPWISIFLDGADVPTPVLDLVAAVLGPREAAARARAGTATTRP